MITVTLHCEDAVVATDVVRHALSMDCVLARYESAAPEKRMPVKVKPKVKTKVKTKAGRATHYCWDLPAEVPYTKGSTRAKIYRKIQSFSVNEMTPKVLKERLAKQFTVDEIRPVLAAMKRDGYIQGVSNES